jgi:hypothetical protein
MNMLFYVLSALPTGEEPPRSLFERIWLYFRGSSVFYPSLGMDDYDVMTARFVAVGLFVGVAIAVFMTVFNKRVLGDIVRGFIKKGAFSPDTALTLDQMGLADSFVARFVVKRSTSLRRVVKCREEERHIASLDVRRTEYENRRKNGEKLPKFKEVEYKVNVLSDSFYIPEDMKHMAEVKFDKKGTTWIGAAVITVIAALISAALVAFMPQIFELIDGLVKTLGN